MSSRRRNPRKPHNRQTDSRRRPRRHPLPSQPPLRLHPPPQLPLQPIIHTSNSDSNSSTPTSLHSTEFQLAESYRAVPAPLWHPLLKSLCTSSSSSSSIALAYAVVSWLQKHNLCFFYELLYSILINALGRSVKLYEAFLLSQLQVFTPLTYNALIGACARNGDVEKALNLISKMRRDGYQPDFVNYSSIIQYLTRSKFDLFP